MADMSTKTDLLITKIIQLLKDGMALSEDTLFFAESTYGLDSSMLAEALKNPQFEGRDALLALMFFPDMKIRMRLEPLLADSAGTDSDVPTLAAGIAGDLDNIKFVLPDGDGFNWPIEEENIYHFVNKLYLNRHMDKDVLTTLRSCFCEEIALRSCTVLRCREDSFTGEKLEFICRFVEKSSLFEDSFLDLFTMVLSLLAEIVENQPIESYFLKQKQRLIKTLKDIRAFEQKRDHYSMEYLMMQCYRVPHESEEETLKQLHLLTTITDIILGLPPDPSFQQGFQNVTTFHFSPPTT